MTGGAKKSGGGGKGVGKRGGKGKEAPSVDLNMRPICQLLTQDAIDVYAKSAHGKKRMTAGSCGDISDVEEAWVDDVLCGFDQNGERLAADEDCIYSITPDTRQPTTEERAAAIKRVVASCSEDQSTGDASEEEDVGDACVATEELVPHMCKESTKYAHCVLEACKRNLFATHTYTEVNTDYLYSYPYRAAYFFHPEGKDLFALDMHLSSTVCCRTCPPNCSSCADKLDKWTRPEHVCKTQHSFALFDRPSHKLELEHALKTGIFGPTLQAYYSDYFSQASINSMPVERTVGGVRRAWDPSTSQLSEGRLGLKMSTVDIPLRASKSEFKEWAAVSKVRLQHKKLVGNKDPDEYCANIRSLADTRDENFIAQGQAGGESCRNVMKGGCGGRCQRAKQLVRGLRMKKFKVKALHALNLPTTGSVRLLGLRLIAASMTLLEDICTALIILSEAKQSGVSASPMPTFLFMCGQSSTSVQAPASTTHQVIIHRPASCFTSQHGEFLSSTQHRVSRSTV